MKKDIKAKQLKKKMYCLIGYNNKNTRLPAFSVGYFPEQAALGFVGQIIQGEHKASFNILNASIKVKNKKYIFLEASVLLMGEINPHFTLIKEIPIETKDWDF